MRKRQKEQAEKLVRLLGKVHIGIRDALNAGKRENAMELLRQCQEAAIDLGETIEQEEGKGFPTVTLLEDYCENVYQVYEAIHQGRDMHAKKMHKKLRQNLIQIENSIRNEIKVRIEMVFLPYKASMWDSLESIWKVAEKDPDCNAYVVPIPYYDRADNGALGQMHYEGGLYPADIPIVDWQEYDVEARHPDVIFIHSPYDSGNYVTSIHPDFYSSRLKKCTELLVYVPYFTFLGELSEGFSITAGSLNADRVVVQSEKARQIYIHAFEEFEKENDCIGRFGSAQEKFLALGSPKFDKVFHSSREDYSLLEKWKHLLKRSDGTEKKIVFYNTSLNAILRGDSKYLAKLRHVLDTFHKREDVLLWWRPHPLSEATLHSMRPWMLQEYDQIVASYRAGEWGIYDDTADLHRAIAWSDAYYGDNSSVAVLFYAAKKPVLLQDADGLPPAFENFLQVEDDYWFTDFSRNGLYKLEGRTGEASFIGCFPGERDRKRLFFSLVRYQNDLVCVPFAAEGIGIYHMDTMEFESIPLKKQEDAPGRAVPFLKERKFSFCVMHDGYAFLFPCTYPAIIKLDMETYEMEYLFHPLTCLDETIKQGRAYYFRKGIKDGNRVWSWCVAAGALVEFDMETCKFESYRHLGGEGTYVEAVWKDKDFWLFPEEGKGEILRYSDSFEKRSSIAFPEGLSSERLPFLNAVALEDAVYAFPGTADHVIRIDPKDDHLEIIPALDGERWEEHQGKPTDWKFFFAERLGDEIAAFDGFSHRLLFWNPAMGSIKRESILGKGISDKSSELFWMAWKAHYRRISQETELAIWEDDRMRLGSFLDILAGKGPVPMEELQVIQGKFLEDNGFYTDGTCGESVYRYAKGHLQRGERS